MAEVFISHRSADLRVARRLAEDLRVLGHNVWLDDDEIRVGDSILDGMNAGLLKADFVVVCYSDVTPSGPWMDREWLSALARQLDGLGVKLLPAKIAGSCGPAILSDIKYANFSANWQAGLYALAAAMR